VKEEETKSTLLGSVGVLKLSKTKEAK